MLTAGLAWNAEAPKPAADPRLLSVYPSVVRAGVVTQLLVRGSALGGARAVVFKAEGLSARVLGADKDEAVRIELAAPAKGNHAFRLVAAGGVSNEVPLRVVEEEIVEESTLAATPINRLPLVVAGKLSARGEIDTIWLEAKAGETITFSCAAGTTGFDPSLVLVEPSGSWFDEGRLNRIAFNDEPLHFPGLSQDARLVHRFERSGRYAIQVRAFAGQGGPDFTYQLRMAPGIGEVPRLHPPLSSRWDERRFVRPLSGEWIASLGQRGGRVLETPQAPVFRAVAAAAGEDDTGTPVMTAPGVVEGRIGKPAEVHRIRLRVDAPQDLVIEVETPEATMPRFNPVVRLMAPGGGGEVVTNVYTKRNNNGLYMMKMIQAKSTFTLRSPGEYLMEIRDITTDVAGDDFAYRVLVRPQIPHVGKAEVAEDHLNLEAGQAKALTVNLEREEGFAGLVLLAAEGLPPGVTATAGMANPVEKPPLPNGGRLERYVGKPQTATLLLSAADDAAPSALPVPVRIVLRTVNGGRASSPILLKEIPVMVVPRRPS